MIRRSTIAELRARGGHLLQAAAAETGCTGGVRWDLLELAEDAGALLLLVVEVDAELVGYIAGGLSPELFDAPKVSCLSMSTYAMPAHRGRWGLRLVAALEDAAAAAGAATRVVANPDTRFALALLRSGWRPQAIAFER